MIGTQVEFPVALGDYRVGTVEAFDEATGRLDVRDEDGELWRGYEHQVIGVPVI